jgi:transposase
VLRTPRPLSRSVTKTTDIVYTSCSRIEGRTDDRARARPSGGPPTGDHPPRSGGDRQRLVDLPLLRDHAPGLLHLARRYEEQGLEGLRDRSRRPHVSPNATKAEVVGKIVYLRQHYHFGPHKIAMHLKRYHDLQISPSGIWRILRRLDMSRLPASQRYRRHVDRWKRYESPCRATGSRSTSSSSPPLQGSRKKHYQSQRSMIAPGSGCCGSTTG